MRAPVHGVMCRTDRRRSVALLTLVTILLMSSAGAQAAGNGDDEGFFQAVIDGRRNAREAYERTMREERLEAAEASSQREQGELLRRSASETSDSGPLARADHRDGANETEEPSSGFPWISGLLVVAALGAFVVLKLRAQTRR
jgi:hypothetical protein